MNHQWKMKSPVGDLYLVASENGLSGLHREKQAVPLLASLRDKQPSTRILAQAETELSEYFSRKRKKFSIPLDLHGTDFQKKVWKQLSKIPYGKTYSYGEIAGQLKNPKAMRAVGSANGKNPVSIIIPCHRVIAADGTLGGYSGGLSMKIKLLELENTTM